MVYYNLKSLKFPRQFMDYFLRYPNIKQKKSIKVKKNSAHWIFWDWAKKWHRSLQAYHLNIGPPNFRNLIYKYFFHIKILTNFFFFFFFIFITSRPILRSCVCEDLWKFLAQFQKIWCTGNFLNIENRIFQERQLFSCRSSSQEKSCVCTLTVLQYYICVYRCYPHL